MKDPRYRRRRWSEYSYGFGLVSNLSGTERTKKTYFSFLKVWWGIGFKWIEPGCGCKHNNGWYVCFWHSGSADTGDIQIGYVSITFCYRWWAELFRTRNQKAKAP